MEESTVQAAATSDVKSEMKPCFGVSFGWFMEDMIGDPEQIRQCYDCADFDRCQKMMLIRSLTQLRFEVRRSAHYLGRAMNGSSSTHPLG